MGLFSVKPKRLQLQGCQLNPLDFLTRFHPTCTIIIYMERVFRMFQIISNT